MDVCRPLFASSWSKILDLLFFLCTNLIEESSFVSLEAFSVIVRMIVKMMCRHRRHAFACCLDFWSRKIAFEERIYDEFDVVTANFKQASQAS